MAKAMNEKVTKESWREAAWSLRQHYLSSQLHIPHPPLVKIFEQINITAQRCKETGRGDAILVVGGSGSGKTHLLRAIAKQRPANHQGEISIVPIVSFSVPFSPNQRAMSWALLTALENPQSSKRGNSTEMFNIAIHQLKTVGTEVILIDNLHDIAERRRADGIMHVGNWIRDLIEQSKCLVVMFGTPLATTVVDGNAQLRRRVPMKMNVRYFSIETDVDIAIFKKFLRKLDELLPVAELSKLDAPEMMLSLYWATMGIADYIFRLVMRAVEIAVSNASERVMMSHFETAYKQMFQDGAKNKNPFSESGPKRVLDATGEPFHNWFDKSNPKLET